MDKTAQKRSLLSKLHEMANVPARSAEEFFKPELKRVMKTLSDADDVVRATLSGEKIGNAQPEDKSSAKSLLKEAKSFINRREYMSAIASLGRFHKKMADVAEVMKNLNLNVDSLHHRFLFEKLPVDQRRHLQGLRERLGHDATNSLTKEAGIMDFFHNIGTQRGRALAAWEKRYPKEVGPIRDGVLAQLDNAQSALDQVLGLLKEMSSYRAGRRIDNYLDGAKQVVAAVNRYDTGKNGFRTFYTDVVKPRLERLEAEEKQSAVPAVSTQNSAQLGQRQVPDTDGETPPPSQVVVDQSSPGASTVLPPPPATPSNVSAPEPVHDTEPSPPPSMTPSAPPEGEIGEKSDKVLQQMMQSKSSNFLQTLEMLSSENPKMVASYISKYATRIQESDPHTALKLFRIAKSLRG